MIHDTQSAQISQKQDSRNTYAIVKTICPPSYHHNGFVATHALGHMIYGYTLLVPMNQRMLNKLSKKYNWSGHKWSTTYRVFKFPTYILCSLLSLLNCDSAVIGPTVHEHIVADAFHYKKRSAARLFHEQQASQKWLFVDLFLFLLTHICSAWMSFDAHYY